MASLELIHYQLRRAEINDCSLQWKDIKRKPIKNLPQIVWEDNSTWAEANIWALDQATSSKRDLKTVRSNMSHLLAYAKSTTVREVLLKMLTLGEKRSC
jgi:hypothetical protein